MVLSLGVHPERVCQRGVPLCRKPKFDQQSAIISKRCEVALGADYVKVVEDRPIQSATEM